MKLAVPSSSAIGTLTIVLMLVAVAAMIPSSSSAGTFGKIVTGFVRDSAGTPLEDADVTVNVRRPDTSIRATMTNDTDHLGQYGVTFESGDWDFGDTIEVISTYLGNQESETTDPLTEEGIQWVNVSYAFEIPEFGSAVGFVITGTLLGAVAVVALVYFKKR